MADVQARSKILVVTRNLPPLVGGMERLNWHMILELAKEFDVRVIGPYASAALMPSDVAVNEVPARPLASFVAASFLRAIWAGIIWRPDVVIAGSGLSAPMAWICARICGARAIGYLHGLDLVVRSRLYQWLWLPFIRRLDHVIVNSTATRNLALGKKICGIRLSIVHPGVSLPDKEQERNIIPDLRGAPILLSVGRITERKGLYEFVRDVLPEIARVHREVRLVIVGGDATDALAAGLNRSGEGLLKIAESAGMRDHITLLGQIDDKLLEDTFRAADVHVFPIREVPGDPEGFGMVAIEAAAHGLPTVAYAVGGITDAVKNGVSGWLVTPGNAKELAFWVNDIIDNPLPGEGIRAFAAQFDWSNFGNRIRILCRARENGGPS